MKVKWGQVRGWNFQSKSNNVKRLSRFQVLSSSIARWKQQNRRELHMKIPVFLLMAQIRTNFAHKIWISELNTSHSSQSIETNMSKQSRKCDSVHRIRPGLIANGSLNASITLAFSLAHLLILFTVELVCTSETHWVVWDVAAHHIPCIFSYRLRSHTGISRPLNLGQKSADCWQFTSTIFVSLIW